MLIFLQQSGQRKINKQTIFCRTAEACCWETILFREKARPDDQTRNTNPTNQPTHTPPHSTEAAGSADEQSAEAQKQLKNGCKSCPAPLPLTILAAYNCGFKIPSDLGHKNTLLGWFNINSIVIACI
jgi:hypothetical protein